MSADVSQLVVLIERILAGSVVSYEEVINADWRADGELDRFANEAHFDLKFWVDDEDIRAKDHEYAAQKRSRLEWLLAELRGVPK